MKESKFQSLVSSALQSVGAFVFNVHGSMMQKAGMPDLYVAHRVWTGWIELKVGSGKVSDLQRIRIMDLLKRGVPAFVVRLRDNGYVECELWTREGCERLTFCENWTLAKGSARGEGLLSMLDNAGAKALEIVYYGNGGEV